MGEAQAPHPHVSEPIHYKVIIQPDEELKFGGTMITLLVPVPAPQVYGGSRGAGVNNKRISESFLRDADKSR
jgi:hypothetical protein